MMNMRFVGIFCLAAAALSPHASAQPMAKTGALATQTVATGTREALCYLEASGLGAWQKSGAITAFDVRDAVSAQRSPLADVMRIKVEEIKLKNFLKEQGVLIVGAGHGEASLEAVCADLKSRGFKRVRILTGGALAWAKQHADLQADLRVFAELSAADLIAERNDDSSGFVVLAKGFSHADFMDRAATARDPASAEALLAAVREASVRKRGIVRRVVILGAAVIDARVLARVLEEAPANVPVYVFSGDAASYGVALKDHQAIWARRSTGAPLKGCNPK